MKNKLFDIVKKWVTQLSKSVFVRQVSSTMLSQGTTLLVSLVTGAITARWLGTNGKGTFSMLLLLSSMLQFFMGFGINVANVYYTGSGRLPVYKLTANSMVFSAIGTVVGIAIVLLTMFINGFDELLPGVPVSYILLGMVALPLGLLTSQLHSVLHGLQRILILNTLTITQTILNLLLTVLFVIWLRLDVLGAVLASLIIQVTMLIVTGHYLRREGGKFWPRWDIQVVRLTLSYGLKGYIGNLFQFFNYRLDVFIVNFFLGPGEVGIYTISVTLAELLWKLPDAASFVIFPKATNSNPESMNAFTPRVFWIILTISSGCALGLALFGNLLIEVIFSPAFLDAYTPLLILLPGVVLLGGAKILANDIVGRGYPHYNSIIAGLSLVVTIAFDIVFIPKMGVVGAALASSFAYTLTFFFSVVIYLFIAQRLKRIPLMTLLKKKIVECL